MRREIVKKLSSVDYHASAGISNSGFNLLLDCPKRYWAKYIHKMPEKEDSKALLIGSAVHTLTFEPELFEKEMQVLPYLDRRRTEDKKTYDSYVATGKKLLKKEEFDLAKSMADSLKSHKYYDKLIKNGHIEDSLFWEEDGIILRSRPDFYNDFCVVELKTTAGADLKSFSSSIANYGYHRQAALQIDLLEKLTGLKRKHFCFLIVESEFPFISSIFRLDDEAINRGREELERAKFIYKNCLEKNEWPSYQDDIEDIFLPSWY